MALADYNSDKIINGEEGEIEEALNKLYDNNTFDDIEIEENIGMIDDYEITLGKEKGEVIIDGIDKATGSIRLRCKVSTTEYTKDSITIHVKASGNIVKLIKPDNKEVTPVNGKIEIDYPVNENGTYIFKVEDAEGTPLEKPVTVDNIDTLSPQDFDITAQQVDKKIVITANTEDAEATETSACSGIDRYEYFVKKSTDTNYPEKAYTTNEVPISEYGTYHILVKAYDKVGNPKDCNEEITIEIVNQNPLKYGQKVNYSVNGVDDWKIFYINDERNETFIITGGFLPLDKVPITSTGMTKWDSYSAYWSTFPSYKEISDEVRSRFMMNWNNNKTNNNIKCVSRLLDTEAWSFLVTSELKEKGVQAIGGPTLEMWLKSFNEVHDTKFQITGNDNSGIRIKGKEDIDGLALRDYTTSGDLFFQHLTGVDVSGYLLAGPSNAPFSGCAYLWAATEHVPNEYRNLGQFDVKYQGAGLRPVLCIDSDMLVYNIDTSSWDINVE